MKQGPLVLQTEVAELLRELAHRARLAATDRELGFLLVNETLALVPYRQAALWLADAGTWALSGLVQVEANVPHVQWLEAVCRHLQSRPCRAGEAFAFTAADLPPDLAADWAQWWPTHALWLASATQGPQPMAGGAVWVRELAWTPAEQSLLQEWSAIWWHAFGALHRPQAGHWPTLRARLARTLAWQPGQPWWRQTRWQVLALVLVMLMLPVRQSVLVPGELVPAHPVVVRAPLDGVIDLFHVQPNQRVEAGQPLFSFDEMTIQSRLDMAHQALATAETDFRQTSQQALTEARAKLQLGVLAGKVEERRAEVDALQAQLERARVLAPVAGVVLMDDPSEWLGKPVGTGERILRLAALDDVEVEAWLPLADAIPLAPGNGVSLYLSASPLSPVEASLRYLAHEAVPRPDGSQAYRLRASLQAATDHRVGLKGTAKIQGPWVPLAYWMLRRPWAALRAQIGL